MGSRKTLWYGLGRDQPMVSNNVSDIFTRNLSAVSAVVHPVASLDETLAYAVALCEVRTSGCLRPGVAAPGLDGPLFHRLTALCADRGVRMVQRNLRRFSDGFDVGFTLADYGIAETGTLVIDSSSEDLRLATMLCDTHVVVLPLSRLRATAAEAAPELTLLMKHPPAAYLAFITGASRTADIERVLALGVHGPLALHALLWEDR